jgi:hypothetical protein
MCLWLLRLKWFLYPRSLPSRLGWASTHSQRSGQCPRIGSLDWDTYVNEGELRVGPGGRAYAVVVIGTKSTEPSMYEGSTPPNVSVPGCLQWRTEQRRSRVNPDRWSPESRGCRRQSGLSCMVQKAFRASDLWVQR